MHRKQNWWTQGEGRGGEGQPQPLNGTIELTGGILLFLIIRTKSDWDWQEENLENPHRSVPWLDVSFLSLSLSALYWVVVLVPTATQQRIPHWLKLPLSRLRRIESNLKLKSLQDNFCWVFLDKIQNIMLVKQYEVIF